MARNNQRIEFANSLRGVAALIVLVGHYVLVFHALGAAFPPFESSGVAPYPELAWLFSQEPLATLNLGPLGVAIFFLISGLVMPISVRRYQALSFGWVGFVVARFFRIWPTYFAGLMVTAGAFWLASKATGTPFYLPLERILTNATLFRDWLGGPQIDGVVWTLEVETKFYLFILLFWLAVARASLVPLAAIAALAIAVSEYPASYDLTLSGASIDGFLVAIPYMVFMSIGVAFNYHLRGQISAAMLGAISVAMFSVFLYVGFKQGYHHTTLVTYGAALGFFATLYFYFPNWTGGRVVQFFARISFPLYASHGMMGYLGMSYMVGLGVPPYLSLAAQVGISIAVATTIHYAVEAPSQRLGKLLFAGKPALATSPR